jgi:hypothetical protein
MGSSFALAAASAALAIQSVSTVPPASAPLKPSSPWVVDYADKMCILQRAFGAGADRVTVGFKPAPAGTSMTVLLLTPGNRSTVTSGGARLTFDGQTAANSRYIEGPVRGPKKFRVAPEGTRIAAIDLKREQLAALPSVKQLRIEAGGVNVLVAPDQLPAALKALSLCEADLLQSWGMDPKVIADIAEYPAIDAPSQSSFFSPSDYPIEAIAAGFQGLAGARVLVGADGKVNECSIIEPSGSTEIDAQTCSIIKSRFRYKPAHLRNGEKVASFTYARIRWELPSS